MGVPAQTLHRFDMKFSLLTSILFVGIAFFTMSALSAEPSKRGKLQHIVSFKFKESASPDQINTLVKAFAELPKRIDEIKSFEWGTNVSPENHDKGFTHCFIVTFESAKSRDAYLVHPAHKEFARLDGPIVADVFVIDFWAQPYNTE